MSDTKRLERFWQSKPGMLRAEITIQLAAQESDAPPFQECRYAVLPITSRGSDGKAGRNYAIFDRLLNRVVDGMYSVLADALNVAASLNVPEGEPGHYVLDIEPPNGDALGLLYPTREGKLYRP